MPVANLSTGCLVDIMNGIEIEKPILQILGSKRIQSTENSERYRLLVSDGKFLNSFAMLATQLNEFVTEGRLSDNTIIKVDRYITSMVNKSEPGQTKRVLIILGLEVLNAGSEVGAKIGTPVVLSENSTNATPPASSASAVNNKATPAATATSSTTTSSSSSFNNNKSSEGQVNKNYSIVSGATGSTGSLSTHTTHPISSLSPYQNKWVIKARVTAKSAIRTWSNPKGEGKLVSMDLMDESKEIRATAFKEQCDKFYDMIQVDKVYFISKCQLKAANRKFTTIDNDYEMTLTNDTIIEECIESDESVPTIQYNFVPISNLANMETNAVVDVIGVCRDVGDIFQFTAKTTGRELKKREITLVDTSNAAISLTLWNKDAEDFDGFAQPIILLKNGRINEFGGGKSISMSSGSSMKINPDISEGHKLRGWFDNGGAEKVGVSISARNPGGGTGFSNEWMDFLDIKTKNLGNGDKADFFVCKAVVHIVKSSNAFYKSCPTPDCNKKVFDQGNGMFRCEKCNADYPNFQYRLLINMSIGDWSSNRWVTVFSDLAEKLFNKSAQEVGELLENNLEMAENILSSIAFKSFIFKLRIKMEFYGDNARNKITAMSATPVIHKEYNQYLINKIQALTGIGRSTATTN